MNVELSSEEILNINKLAKSIQDFKRNNGVKTKKFVKHKDDLLINIEGLQAEFAVAKFLGISFKNTWVDYTGDNGIDLDYNNQTLQVKFSGYDYGNLYFNFLEDFKADIAILVVKINNLHKICGWIDKETFKSKYIIKDFGYGIRYCVEQKDLIPIEKIMKKTNKLSHTAAELYITCPLSYKLYYKDYIRSVRTKSALPFGAALDAGLNSLLSNKNLQIAQAIFVGKWRYGTINNEVVDFFDKDKDRITYSKADHDPYLGNTPYESLKAKGLMMIQTYRDKILPILGKVIVIQEPIVLENTEGDMIRGSLDLIVEIQGKRYLLDNKSSSIVYEQDSPSKSDQLALYFYLKNEEYDLEQVGFVVLNKNVNHNIKKTCNKCGFVGDRAKDCNNKVDKKRCGGEWIVTTNPEIEWQIILNDITEQKQQEVLEKFDAVNHGISNNKFEPNHKSCYGKYGKCQYYGLCHHDSFEGLVKLEKKEK